MEFSHKDTSEIASSSRWLENNNITNPPIHSQWLHSTLSEIDKKMSTILETIEDNGDTLIETGKMFFQKRPQLIEQVQDVRKAYISLAHKYDQLKYADSILVKSTPSNHGGSSSNPSLKQHFQQSSNRFYEASNKSRQLSGRKLFLEDNVNSELQRSSLGELLVESISKNMMSNENGHGFDELRLKIPKLVEDSLSKQAELIKRNNEKREAIKELEFEVRRLLEENKMLKDSRQFQEAGQYSSSCNGSSTKKQVKKSSSLSRIKGAIFRRKSHET